MAFIDLDIYFIYFLGRVIQSTHISVASFAVISLGYYVNCRRIWAKNNFMTRQAEDTFPEEIESLSANKIPKEYFENPPTN